jgi:hypothetical protein
VSLSISQESEDVEAIIELLDDGADMTEAFKCFLKLGNQDSQGNLRFSSRKS